MKLKKIPPPLCSMFFLIYLTGVLISTALHGENKFLVEPYLLDVTTDSATVGFHLPVPHTAVVTVFHPGGKKKLQEFPSAESKSHFVRITGLEPGQTYRYEVVCSDMGLQTPPGDRTYQIRTAGRSGEYFTFAVYGDPRPGDNVTHRQHAQVLQQVMLQEPSFNLVLGDMVDDGSNHDHWNDFFDVEARLLRRSAIYAVKGDNDHAEGNGKYAEYFPKLKRGYYGFQWNGVYFFGLNAWNTRGTQPQDQFNGKSPQVQWLEAQLSKPEVRKAPFRVVFLHDPVYICRGRSSAALRHALVPVLQKHKVDVVFASWHLYERSLEKGITYIISGGAGAELLWNNKNPAFPSQVDARQYHFCRVDVNANAMTIRSISDDGTVLDSITLTPRAESGESTRQIQQAARRLKKNITINQIRPGQSGNGTQAPSIPPLSLLLFSYDCNYCRRLLKLELPAWARQNGITVNVQYYDLGRKGTYDLFLNAGAEFGRQNADVPAVFIGKTVLGGKQEIQREMPNQIDAYKKDPRQYNDNAVTPFKDKHDTRTIGEETFNMLTIGIVLAAGLLDGINPCAFTTIIFLISYLSLVGASRRRMIYTGGIFTAAVFLTYLFIGMVFFNVAKIILKQQAIARTVNIVLLIIVATLAIISLTDAIKCLKGKAADMTLQLPGFLKKGIHEKIRNFARRKIALFGTSFILGIVIAGMELTCTGQVYIPIVTMISEPQHRVMALLYLLMYNIAFIIPLAAVFVMVAFGLTSDKLALIFKRHIAGVKIGFAFLFFLMALMIIYNLRWL
jgi:cytochrome c biogenesis protein CcdA